MEWSSWNISERKNASFLRINQGSEQKILHFRRTIVPWKRSIRWMLFLKKVAAKETKFSRTVGSSKTKKRIPFFFPCCYLNSIHFFSWSSIISRLCRNRSAAVCTLQTLSSNALMMFLWKTFRKLYYLKIATTMNSLHCRSILSRFAWFHFVECPAMQTLRNTEHIWNCSGPVYACLCLSVFVSCFLCAPLVRFKSMYLSWIISWFCHLFNFVLL